MTESSVTRANDSDGTAIATVLRKGDLARLQGVVLYDNDGRQIFRDPFGRLRVSEPHTTFSSHHAHDERALLWTESASGGSSSAHDANIAAVVMTTAGGASDTIKRRTKTYVRYDPGKASLWRFTFRFVDGQASVKKRIGCYDDEDGYFLELDASTLYVVRRTSTSGSPVDNRVAMTSWNGDRLDGTGISGHTLDLSYRYHLMIEYEWLGTGQCRFMLELDGHQVLLHKFSAEGLTVPTMARGMLPGMAEVLPSDTHTPTTLEIGCVTAFTEGPLQPKEEEGYASNENAKTVSSSLVPIISMRLSAAGIKQTAILEEWSTIALTAAEFEIRLILNGTLTGASWAAANATTFIEIDTSATAITGGTAIGGGFTGDKIATTIDPTPTSHFGSTLAGVSDILSLCARRLDGAGNVSVFGSLHWHEIG